MNKDYYSVIFHYNIYTETWYCIPRTHYREYFNGDAKDNIGSGSTIEHAFIMYQDKMDAGVH
jgi:hypothetical protein